MRVMRVLWEMLGGSGGGAPFSSTSHGVTPHTSSYSSTPSPHQSHAPLWPVCCTTSGAMYSSEPHTVKSRSLAPTRFASPKSTSFA